MCGDSGLVRHTRNACHNADFGKHSGMHNIDRDSLIWHGAIDNDEECSLHSFIHYNNVCV